MSYYRVNASPMIRSKYQEMTGRQDISSSVGNIALVMNQIGLLPPVGSVSTYAGIQAPTGYILCDGSAISRTVYHALFQVIGTTYGSGDGSTTFNVPNLKGKFVVGFDSAQTEFDNLSETGGAKTHTLTIAEMPSHNHDGLTQSAGTHTHTITDPGHSHAITDPSHTHTSNAIGGQGNYGLALADGTNTVTSTDSSSGELNVWTTPGTLSINSSTTGITVNSNTTGITNQSTGAHQHVINSQGGGQPHNNLPPYLVLNYIIKH